RRAFQSRDFRGRRRIAEHANTLGVLGESGLAEQMILSLGRLCVARDAGVDQVSHSVPYRSNEPDRPCPYPSSNPVNNRHWIAMDRGGGNPGIFGRSAPPSSGVSSNGRLLT